MFSINPSNSKQSVDDDEDFVFNLTDFEFNTNLAETIQESRPDFSKSIQYQHHDEVSDHHANQQQHLSEDYWLYISEFIPLYDFNRFSLVCTAFAEILTYNRRYLVLKKISKDFKKVFMSSPDLNADSIITLTGTSLCFSQYYLSMYKLINQWKDPQVTIPTSPKHYNLTFLTF